MIHIIIGTILMFVGLLAFIIQLGKQVNRLNNRLVNREAKDELARVNALQDNNSPVHQG